MARADGPRPPAGGACSEGACDGSGWIFDDDVARPCACRGGRIKRARWRAIAKDIPERFRDVSFDRPPICNLDSGVVRHVRQFISRIDHQLDEGHGLWFWSERRDGDPPEYSGAGTGKTALATLVSKEADRAGRTVALYSTPRLLAEIRHTYRDDSKLSYLDLFSRLSDVDLLQLDDLGAENQTDWVLEQLYSIVNERWQDKRSIVITTNYSHDALREQIGYRTVSRLFEVCGEPITICGPDLRVVVSPLDQARESAS